ncbi:MAG: polysaccharide deacetylase family protein [Oscillospiraceae bacterium]
MSRKVSIFIFLVDIALMLLFIFSRWKVSLTLAGPEEMTIEYGQEYVEPGATAQIQGKDIDIFDGDVKVKARASDMDFSEPGTYTITYRASRLFYSDTKERVVHVVDGSAPAITLNDVKTELDAGDVWQDSYSAYDDFDGDITSLVQVSGEVDTKTAGMYTLEYSVTDSAGNTTTAQREVNVIGVSEPVSGKVVFLTFDDGPCENTEELLEILDRHNAKVTFFVTNTGGSYTSLIQQEAEAGHTVAVHTLTHNFNSIYASEQAYWDDFNAMNDIIEQYTGHRTQLFRFPGGSSNTVSSFNPGIMTRLTAEADEYGYEYFDWNVDSGDGANVNDPDQIFNNVISGIKNNDVSVVLCHDTHHTTVQAIDRILTWCEENGYTVMPLAKGMTVSHHSVAN